MIHDIKLGYKDVKTSPTIMVIGSCALCTATNDVYNHDSAS